MKKRVISIILVLTMILVILPFAVSADAQHMFNDHWTVVRHLWVSGGEVLVFAEINLGHTTGHAYWMVVPAEYMELDEDPLAPVDGVAWNLMTVGPELGEGLGWAFGFTATGSPPRDDYFWLPELATELAGVTGEYYLVVWSAVGAGPQLANQAHYGPFQITNGNYGQAPTEWPITLPDGWTGGTAQDPTDDITINDPIFHVPVPDVISVTINGSLLEFDSDPIIYENRTMVPMRVIFEALGLEVEWDNDTRTAIGTRAAFRVEIPIGSTTAYVNRALFELDVPAMLHNDRTYVPVRFIAEATGADVDWDADTQTVIILHDNL